MFCFRVGEINDVILSLEQFMVIIELYDVDNSFEKVYVIFVLRFTVILKIFILDQFDVWLVYFCYLRYDGYFELMLKGYLIII